MLNLLKIHQSFSMSELDARNGESSSPIESEVSPDVRYAEALRALTERSLGSEDPRGHRDGEAILRYACAAAERIELSSLISVKTSCHCPHDRRDSKPIQEPFIFCWCSSSGSDHLHKRLWLR